MNFDDYKKTVIPLRVEMTEIERKRLKEIKKIKDELIEIGKNSKLSDPKRFAELIKELEKFKFFYHDCHRFYKNEEE